MKLRIRKGARADDWNFDVVDDDGNHVTAIDMVKTLQIDADPHGVRALMSICGPAVEEIDMLVELGAVTVAEELEPRMLVDARLAHAGEERRHTLLARVLSQSIWFAVGGLVAIGLWRLLG